MKKRIAITGGAGFIGTHLAERLADQAELVLLDNLRRDSLKWVPALRDRSNVRFVPGDVLDGRQMAKEIEGADTVVHLAAIAGVSSYYKQPLETLRVNLLGTVNVLEAAQTAGVKRFVYVSTSEVFGPDAMWVSETTPQRIGSGQDKRWVYATSKLAGEQFVMCFGEQHGIGCTVLRPFNVYGPRQTGEGAIANFCAAAVRGEPLVVYGDGSAIRAWCYVTDFVDAVARVLDRPEAVGESFNIGNPREVLTTLTLAREVVRLAPDVRIESKEVDRAEVRGRVPVIDKARKLLGWEPEVDVVEGLRKTLEWHKEVVTCA